MGAQVGGDEGKSKRGGFSDNAEINVVPFVDIMLVLLIIFMVISSVMADAGARSGMRVNLPKGATQEVKPAAEDVTIAIGVDGKMVVRGKQVDVEELTRILKEAQQRSPDTQVIVQADEAAHHGKVVAVMELAKTTGLTRLAIATRRGR